MLPFSKPHEEEIVMEKNWKGKKDRRSRAAFNVGIKYNSILDNDSDESSDSFDNTVDFDSVFDVSNSKITQCDISLSSSFHEDTSMLKPPLKRRRIVKKAQRGFGNPIRKCLNTSVLPDSFQSVFPFKEFNKMQSEAFPQLYETNTNCVISSPTGSGKTVLFELAILRLMKEQQQQQQGMIGDVKILYMGPTKSLCYERLRSWGPNFLNFTVGMLTGDTFYAETEKVRKCNIIITTPEKWDLLTRKWEDYKGLFHLVRLILVDEIHTLREKRGATLEVVLTRMNLMCENIRIIALSATIPNVEDISVWLTSGSNQEKAKVLEFDDSYRQVSLQKIVYGYASYNKNKNDFLCDGLYNSKLDDVLRMHSQDRPVLIFCPTRASTVSTAKYVVQNCTNLAGGLYKETKEKLQDQCLFECYSQGVAFHHAGLSIEDRVKVELGFLEGHVKILCSTSTLAIGVNLPAYLVIIKGTRIWNSSSLQEYSKLDILQMIGRAGRPNFEKEGCAIIMTESKMKQTYEKMLHGTENLESSLHLELTEHLSSEISLGTVNSADMALNWLRHTFLYVRFSRNPNAYGKVTKFMSYNGVEDSQLKQFCESILRDLQRNQIIEEREGFLVCTPYGRSMVRHYVLFDSAKLFIKSPRSQSVHNVLCLLSASQEFADIRLRHNEKRLYKEINSSPLIKFPFLMERKQSQTVDTTLQKVSLLIQYELGGLEFPSYQGASKLYQTLVQDKILVFRNCFRILNCMVDTFVSKGDGISLKSTLFMLRSIHGKCWEESAMVLRQLRYIEPISIKKLVYHNIDNLEEMRQTSDQQIEHYLSQKKGSGSKIKGDLNLLPQLQLKCELEYCSQRDQHLEITLRIELSAQFVNSIWHGQELSVDIEALKTTGNLLEFRRLKLAQLRDPRHFKIMTMMLYSDCIEVSANCSEVAGIGKVVRFSVHDLPQKFSSVAPIQKTRTSVLDECLIHSDTEAELDENSLSSDDCLFQYLNKNPGNHEPSEEDAPDNRRLRSNGNFECNHNCKDKSHCRHLCCKEGIPKGSLRHKKAVSLPQLNPNCLTLKQHDGASSSDNVREIPNCGSALKGSVHPQPIAESVSLSAISDYVIPIPNSGDVSRSVDVSIPDAAILASQSSDLISSDYSEMDHAKLVFLGSDVDLN